MGCVKGKEIVTDWYDGPLQSMCLVVFDDGDQLVEVKTNLAPVSEPYTIGRCNTVRDVTVRFSRTDLTNMLRVLDGLPIKDWQDEEVASVPPCTTNAGGCACGDLHVGGMVKS
jgi:hypothetical protein